MSGIYIPGMEMPTSCPCELRGIGYDLYCSFARGIPARVKQYYECCQNNKRPSWCPLIPVPDHGRLIDADKLTLTDIDIALCEDYKSLLSLYINKVESAQTVIEAEEDGT